MISWAISYPHRFDGRLLAVIVILLTAVHFPPCAKDFWWRTSAWNHNPATILHSKWEQRYGEWDQSASLLPASVLASIQQHCSGDDVEFYKELRVFSSTFTYPFCMPYQTPQWPPLPLMCPGEAVLPINLVDHERGERIVGSLWVQNARHAAKRSGPLVAYIFAPGLGRSAGDYSWVLAANALVIIVPGYPTDRALRFERDMAIQADDVAFVASELPRLWREGSSALPEAFRRLFNGEVVVGGHSIGAGHALLGVSSVWTPPHRLYREPPPLWVGFGPGFAQCAPVVTRVHVSSARLQAALLITGEDDCLAPAAYEAGPVFDALDAPYKVILLLRGAGHTHWVGPSCRSTAPNPIISVRECVSMTKQEQRAAGIEVLNAFLRARPGVNAREEHSAGARAGLHPTAWKEFEEVLQRGEARGRWRWRSGAPGRSAEPMVWPSCPRPHCDDSQLRGFLNNAQVGLCATATFYPGRYANNRTGYEIGACRGPICRLRNCSLNYNRADVYPQVHYRGAPER